MTTVWNGVPNSVDLSRAFAGTQIFPGEPVAPTFRLYGDWKLNAKRSLADRKEYAGDYFGNRSPVFGPWEIDGTYEQSLSYEDWAVLPRYAINGGDNPVDDGNTVHGYTRIVRPDGSRIGIDAMTVESGVPGLPFKADTVVFPESTVSADVDDAEAAWKWSSKVIARSNDPIPETTGVATGGTLSTIVNSGAGWTPNAFQGAFVRMTSGTAQNIGQVREVLSNNATTLTLRGDLPASVANTDTFEISGMFTAGVPDRARETIDAPGTLLFLDDILSLGTSQQDGRFINFSLTYMSGITGFKRFMENVENFSGRPDQGMKKIAGQIRVEYDSQREYRNWRAKRPEKIRIKKEGSVIDPSAGSKKLAQIDVYCAYWGDVTPDNRDNNLTRTWGLVGFVDATEGVPWQLSSKTTLATLP